MEYLKGETLAGSLTRRQASVVTGVALRCPDRRRRGGGAYRRDRSSRPETRQRHADEDTGPDCWTSASPRSARSAARDDARLTRSRATQTAEGSLRHRRLHVARTGRRQARRHPVRRLQLRVAALRGVPAGNEPFAATPTSRRSQRSSRRILRRLPPSSRLNSGRSSLAVCARTPTSDTSTSPTCGSRSRSSRMIPNRGRLRTRARGSRLGPAGSPVRQPPWRWWRSRLGWWVYRGVDGTAPSSLEAVPLTSETENGGSPRCSGDGTQVAYSWNGENQDNYDIYVKLIGAPKPLRLTTDPGDDRNPVFSPDGRTIGFIRVSNRGRAFVMTPPIGGSERAVAELPRLSSIERRARWRPVPARPPNGAGRLRGCPMAGPSSWTGCERCRSKRARSAT